MPRRIVWSLPASETAGSTVPGPRARPPVGSGPRSACWEGGGALGSAGSLSTRTESLDGTVVLSVSGELDLATREQLRSALEWIEANGEELVVVDLRGLSFIDATGLHALIEARDSARMRGATLEFRNPSPALRRLIELVGIEDLIQEVMEGA